MGHAMAEMYGHDTAEMYGHAMACPYVMARGSREANLDRAGVKGEDLRPFSPGGAVALINHDVAEVVFRIIGGKKIRSTFFSVNIESLIGRNVNAGVPGMVLAIGIFVDFRRIASKGVL